MVERNDRVIVDALKAMSHVKGQANMVLQAQHNQHGVVDEFYGLGKF